MHLRLLPSIALTGLAVAIPVLAADETYFDRLRQAAGGSFRTTGIDLTSSAGAIIGGLLGLLGIVFLVLTIYAGVQWMTAGGNEEQITSAKALLKNAVIGLAIILASVVIVNFIFAFFGLGAAPAAPVDPATP